MAELNSSYRIFYFIQRWRIYGYSHYIRNYEHRNTSCRRHCWQANLYKSTVLFISLFNSAKYIDFNIKTWQFQSFQTWTFYTYIECKLSRVNCHSTGIHKRSNMLYGISIKYFFSCYWTCSIIGQSCCQNWITLAVHLKWVELKQKKMKTQKNWEYPFKIWKCLDWNSYKTFINYWNVLENIVRAFFWYLHQEESTDFPSKSKSKRNLYQQSLFLQDKWSCWTERFPHLQLSVNENHNLIKKNSITENLNRWEWKDIKYIYTDLKNLHDIFVFSS